MKKGNIRHMFPGNNTGRGFFSYFAYILPLKKAKRFYCLKGGPGVGKSSFLKRIGERMALEGFDLEYMHCASDPDSLDALVIPALGVALVDGTAPHVTDPVYPAAVDEIINLGEFWNGEAIRRNRDEIVRINSEIKQHYKRAFQYLAAAKCMMDDIVETFESALDPAAPMLEAQYIIDKELKQQEAGGRPGEIRRMFASAITPNGIVHHLESLKDDDFKVYLIKNQWGAGVHKLLQRISDEAVRLGLDTELYYCPLAPDTRIEHMLIPKLKLAFFSEVESFDPKNRQWETLDMTRCLDATHLFGQKDALEFGVAAFYTLRNEAVNVLAGTKELHDELEVYYTPHMDFDRVREKEETICRQILELSAAR
jgi:hypothetical protein